MNEFFWVGVLVGVATSFGAILLFSILHMAKREPIAPDSLAEPEAEIKIVHMPPIAEFRSNKH